MKRVNAFAEVILGPFIRGKIRRELYHLYEHVLSNKTRLSLAASYFRRNVPFIRKVRVLCKTRLIFPCINGPIEIFQRGLN